MKPLIWFSVVSVVILLLIQLYNGKVRLDKINILKNIVNIELAEIDWVSKVEMDVPELFVDAQRLAQATCTSLRPDPGWVFAVARECSETAPSCAEICNAKAENQAKGLSCFDSLHIYFNQPADKLDEIGLKTYKYQSCAGSFCGPNFCCCGSI